MSIIKKENERKGAKEQMKLAETLAGVHTHTHTHTRTSIKINKTIDNLNSKKFKNIILEDSFKKCA